MVRNDFSAIARRYERDSSAQRAAAEVLLDLLRLAPGEHVLDLGCGTGHLTRRLRELTGGRVVGLDPAPGMIVAATARHGGAGVEFAVDTAEALAYDAAFDVVFCNSALHWFQDPAAALAACRRALRPGGRIGVQAPATRTYCVQFEAAEQRAARDPRTAATFARWRRPWRLLETAEAYEALFRSAGFTVDLARIDVLRAPYDLQDAMAVFETGAAAGYVDPAHYDAPWPEGYADAFRRVVLESLAGAADAEGRLELEFHRVFVVARRAG